LKKNRKERKKEGKTHTIVVVYAQLSKPNLIRGEVANQKVG